MGKKNETEPAVFRFKLTQSQYQLIVSAIATGAYGHDGREHDDYVELTRELFSQASKQVEKQKEKEEKKANG